MGKNRTHIKYSAHLSEVWKRNSNKQVQLKICNRMQTEIKVLQANPMA